MATTDAQLGRGTTVSYRTTVGTGTYTAIGTLVSVDGPGLTVGEVETPLLANTFKQYMPTLPEAELTLNVRLNNADAVNIAIRAAVKQAPVPIWDWKIVYPDTYIDTFSGFCKSFTVSGGENETVLMAAIAIRATTAVATAIGP